MPPEISEEESRQFSQSYREAEVQPNGRFQVANMQPPPGRDDDRWAYRMFEERDCSKVPGKVAAMVKEIDESVIASSRHPLGQGVTGTALRTVTGHAKSNGDHRLLADGRHDGREAAEDSKLTSRVLKAYFTAAVDCDPKACSAPLYGFDDELSHDVERRYLIGQRTPYAILLDPRFQVEHVIKPLSEAPDVFDSFPVEEIFDYETKKRRCDRDRVTKLEIEDLFLRRPAHKEREFVFEVPMDEGALYFLVWPGLALDDPLRLQAALKLVRRATQLVLESPAIRLRTHEFHHPHVERYRTILYIVEYGRAE